MNQLTSNQLMEKQAVISLATFRGWSLRFPLAFLFASGFATSNGLGHEHSTQRLTIQFHDAEAAKRAVVSIEPLYNGHHRAVSCRWDDNWTSDNEGTRDLMEEFGIRGTWYLNDREFSPENRPADYLPVAKRLLRGGNSVGGHSLTHPYITYFHSNRMFAEMSGVRVVWESLLDRPVLSYAYSFVDIAPGPEYQNVQQRTLDSLTRAGFDHVAEYLHFFENVEMQQELSPIMPPENNDFGQFRSAVNWAYGDAKLTRKYPMITNSMHAWYGTPRLNFGYEELRKRFELLVSLKDVWHCNQNQYAGYRRQFKNAKLGKVERTGAVVSFQLIRPSVLALNDDTPLTLKIAGVERGHVQSVTCNDTAISMSDRKDVEHVLFHVPHRSGDRLPIRIGHIANPKNLPELDQLYRDKDFPQLVGGLFAHGKKLSLSLRCDDGHPLEDVRVVWRCPIGYDVELDAQYVELDDEAKLDVHQVLHRSVKPDKQWGREHFAAQVDFRFRGEPGRMHLTCQRAGNPPDGSLPRDGFSVLGPVNVNAATANELKHTARDEWAKRHWDGDQWSLPNGTDMKWRAKGRDGYIDQAWLNPEYVRTMGAWDTFSQTYLLRSKVWCPEKRRAHLTVSHPKIASVFVNGDEVVSGEVELVEGENRMLVIYPGCSLGVGTQRVAACFLRLADPSTGLRMRDIRYRAY